MRALLVAAVALFAASGCGVSESAGDGRLQVVTTTSLLRDMVEQVGGERVHVTSLVPDGADPHAYEPTLRDVRDVVYADVAFSNYMLLEQHSVIKTLDANLRDGVPNVSLAEDATKYAAEVIPLVENVNLDTIWLGLRARGTAGSDRTSDVELTLTHASGPGDVFGYLTGTFGATEVYFGGTQGTATLPADAHTHMSWVFTRPGLYTATFAAKLRSGTTETPLGRATFTFAVGVQPPAGATVLDRGHADITADLDQRRVLVLYDPEGGGEHAQREYAAEDVVIAVPSKAIAEVPAGREFRFMGRPGEQIYQLPQAVLGKHVHGEIDPHLWQNVRNVMAYAELIRDTLIGQDPRGAKRYRARTDAYLARLDVLDRHLRTTIAAIPQPRRYLVTTHDAFGYLGAAYGIQIAGFVTPNPAVEPSLADRRKLTETIRNLQVPSVFLEPGLAGRTTTLREVAEETGARLCPIYSDTLDETVGTYEAMMRFNADSLRRCLS
ncbi:anchored repeat ABC transporter, substrate-binding protein [Solirubrobacter taibaiensis]|nr:anchored repeat ABC transporter, substrate-binding protein [Solirubrobacter taibaiensis]